MCGDVKEEIYFFHKVRPENKNILDPKFLLAFFYHMYILRILKLSLEIMPTKPSLFFSCLTLIHLYYSLTASITNIINGDDADEAEIYKNCMKNSLVLSEVFCLPSDYKKDVPPPSKYWN